VENDKGVLVSTLNRMGVNMRTLVTSCAVLALIGAGSAMADSTSVEITATQEETCQINAGTSTTIALGDVDEPIAGTFEYECNFVGSPHLTFTSANGGVTNGSDVADYGIYLNDVAPASPPSAWLQASASTSGAEFDGITSTTAANTNTTTNFSVGLTEPLPVAGDYSDTLTIDLVP
jgi:hypothetical protein